MILSGGAAKLLLPVGEKVGMRGFGGTETSQVSYPLTLPSPPWGEGI
jgi:hypothetical protein